MQPIKCLITSEKKALSYFCQISLFVNRELDQHGLFFNIGVSEPSIQLYLKRLNFVETIHDET